MQLRGSLSEINFAEILKQSAAANLTGMIRLESGPVIKVIYFQNGTIAFASSNEKEDRLTEVLKRAGKLTPEQVEDAQSRLKPNISLGKTLVELGYISARDLLWGARAQVEGILHQLLFWESGVFQVLEGALPKEIIVLNLSVPGVIFDGICKTRDRKWVLQQIESPQSIYRLALDFQGKYTPHKLRMLRADDIVSRVDGIRSVEKIAHLAGIDSFEACKMTAALQILGLVEKIENEPHVLPQSPVVFDAQMPPSEREPEPELDTRPTKAEQLILEPSPPVSLGEVVQLPSVEQLHPPSVPAEQPTNLLETEHAAGVEEEPPAGENWQPAESPAEETEISNEDEHDYQQSGGRRWLVSIIAVVALGSLAASGYYYYSRTHTHWQPSVPEGQQKQTDDHNRESRAVQPGSESVQSAPDIEKKEEEPAATIELSPPHAILPSSGPLTLLESGNFAEAAAQWRKLLDRERTKYAVQLAIACQTTTISDALAHLNNKAKFYILPLEFRHQPCYRVLIGNFETRDLADDARTNLPAEFLQQASPAQIVPVSRLLK